MLIDGQSGSLVPIRKLQNPAQERRRIPLPVNRRPNTFVVRGAPGEREVGEVHDRRIRI
jgi:hypothetical protein